VFLGLAAASSWGAGDFGGGLASRRTAVYGVVLVGQSVGVVIVLALMVARGESAPSGPDIAWSMVAGLLGAVGLTALYRGLAVGRMGIVAPVTGVLAAIIPVIAGIVLEGVPGPFVLVGIAAALVSVVVVSLVADEGGGRAGLGLAILAGTTIGLFGIAIAQLSDGHVFGPLAVVRSTQCVLISVLIVVTRSVWRPSARLLPALALIGVADVGGNAFYILAVQSGALAVASVTSSLYPVVTVILAAVLLRERVTRTHALGIMLAALGIVLIGAGSS
jgi:drug/metabolite transporter (DMT)-like permease